MNASVERINQELETIIKQIKKYAPKFAPFFDLDMTIEEYSKQLYDFDLPESFVDRQKLIKDKIEAKLKNLYGKDFDQLNFAFDPKMAISIVDHHMMLSHPFLASCNIIGNVHKYNQASKPNPIIVISSSDVPPNNLYSKNGFQYHDKRVPLFSVSEREHIFYYIPKKDFDFVKKLKSINRWSDFDEKEQVFLLEHQKFVDGIDFSRCRDYCDQVTLLVQKTWPLLFESKLRANLPELLYITQEELVTDCLIELLEDDNNIVSKSLFDEKFRNSVIENFRGNVVCWRESEQKGTHFFWRKYPDQPRTLRMYVDGNKLVPQDERFKNLAVPLEKKTIIEMLKTREISPSLFTIFAVLNFYAGIRPLTGHGSSVYIELLKESWIKTLTEHNLKEDLELVKTILANGLVTVIVCFQRVNGLVRAQYAHDLMENGGLTREFMEKLSQAKFVDALKVGVPDMYPYFANKYIPADVQIKPTVTLDDVANIVFDWVK